MPTARWFSCEGKVSQERNKTNAAALRRLRENDGNERKDECPVRRGRGKLQLGKVPKNCVCFRDRVYSRLLGEGWRPEKVLGAKVLFNGVKKRCGRIHKGLTYRRKPPIARYERGEGILAVAWN